jgi:AhpD family alkylhydroperoxidase
MPVGRKPFQFSLPVDKLTPHLMEAMEQLEEAGEKVSLPEMLLELVRTRASQVNRCAFCVDAHTTAAREAGVTERQLAALPVWREAPFFSDRERAALALTEAITLVSQEAVGDDLWAATAEHFSEQELAELTWAIAIINVWNRLAGAARPWPIS